MATQPPLTAAEIASVILFLSADAPIALMGSILLADLGYAIW